MALIEGTTYGGYFSELTVVSLTRPSKSGSSTDRYRGEQVVAANIEKTITKIGASIGIDRSALAALFGSEF